MPISTIPFGAKVADRCSSQRRGGDSEVQSTRSPARRPGRGGPRQLNTSAVPQDLCPDLQDLTWPDLSDLTREAGAFALPPSSASDGLTEA
jgi:hypothetical protein